MKIAHDGEAGCDFLVCSSCGSHVMENVQAIVELRKAIAEAVEERDARNAEEAQIMSVIAAFLDADFICQFCHHEVHFEAIVLKELESADS
jgi:DNA-directed RNA polymerase subunit M/transcription elongation factor TFIIS